MGLKCADIGHTSKSQELHLEWTRRVTNEFFNQVKKKKKFDTQFKVMNPPQSLQGDREKSLNLPVSAFMDRNNQDIPKSQCGFISYLVTPLYAAWTQEFPSTQLCAEQLEKNLKYWKEEEMKKNSVCSHGEKK